MKFALTIVSLSAGVGFGYMQHNSLAPKLAFLNQPAKVKKSHNSDSQLANSTKSPAIEQAGNYAPAPTQPATSTHAALAQNTPSSAAAIPVVSSGSQQVTHEQPATQPSETLVVSPELTTEAPAVAEPQPKAKPSPDSWKLCKEVTVPASNPMAAPQKLAAGTPVYVLANMKGNVVIVTKGEKRSASAVPADAVASPDGQNPEPAAYANFDQAMLSRIDELVNEQLSSYQAANPQAAAAAPTEVAQIKLLGDLPLKKLMRENLQAKPLQNMPLSSIKKVTYLGQQLFAGKQSEIGEVEFQMQSIMGEMPMKALAVFQDQKLVGWFWAKSQLPMR